MSPAPQISRFAELRRAVDRQFVVMMILQMATILAGFAWIVIEVSR